MTLLQYEKKSDAILTTPQWAICTCNTFPTCYPHIIYMWYLYCTLGVLYTGRIKLVRNVITKTYVVSPCSLLCCLNMSIYILSWKSILWSISFVIYTHNTVHTPPFTCRVKYRNEMNVLFNTLGDTIGLKYSNTLFIEICVPMCLNIPKDLLRKPIKSIYLKCRH